MAWVVGVFHLHDEELQSAHCPDHVRFLTTPLKTTEKACDTPSVVYEPNSEALPLAGRRPFPFGFSHFELINEHYLPVKFNFIWPNFRSSGLLIGAYPKTPLLNNVILIRRGGEESRRIDIFRRREGLGMKVFG